MTLHYQHMLSYSNGVMFFSTNWKKVIKAKIDILKLILTNHFFHAHNLSVKNGENNGLLAGVPFLSPSRAQIPPSPSSFNVCHAGYRPHGPHC